MSGFLGLSIALSGVRAQQQALAVTANNIANASTEGYHRQEAEFVAGSPLSGAFANMGVGAPQLGTGVTVHAVKRLQSQYVDKQVRSSHEQLGTWEYRQEQLGQIESIFQEPGDQGLSASMDKFWNAWDELAASPESQAAKISVVQTGVTLSQRFTTLYHDLRQMQSQTDKDIVDNVTQVNQLAHDIANIDRQIKRSIADGYQPNELLDRRDVLLDKLSTIASVQTCGGEGADLIVAISGKPLIQGDLVTELATTQDAEGWTQISWSSDGAPVRITSGQLAGQLQMRDDVLQSHIDSLNQLAAEVVGQVNLLHSTGVISGGAQAGGFFVSGSDASNISVEPALVANPAGVATSTTGNPGDNSLAESIAGLRSQKLASGETLGDTYLRIVSTIGAQSREAITRTDTYSLTLQQLKSQRDSISGVSLDEEMLNLTKFQQAYNASARMATTIDEMIDTIVSRMGVVGR